MNIKKNSELLEQTNNLLFPLKGGGIIFYNSLKLLYIRLKYYSYLLQYNQENIIIPDFCSITRDDGIYCWRREGSSIYTSSGVFDDGALYLKGVFSSDGILIIGGYSDKKVRIYQIANGSPPTFNLLDTYSHQGTAVYHCFLYNSENVICLDNAGYAKKYNFQTRQESAFYYNPGEALYSGIQTMDKLVVIINGDTAKIYILDEYGNQINIHTYSSPSDTYEIAEVRRNILLSADKESVYLHDIKDPNNIPTSIRVFIEDFYYSIISLKNNEGGFAIGGNRDSKGFVDIYHLSEHNIPTRIKTKGAIEGTGCSIYSIKELITWTIIFGGPSGCEVICLWNYAAWPEQGPECWDSQPTHKVNDFIALPE